MNTTKTTTMLAALALALCLAAPTAFAQQQEGEVLLQEAQHKEIVDGELEEAISLYQKIVDNVSDIGRAVAARALVQMGRSYEKLGVHLVAEARQAYEQVVRDYKDQPDMVAEARSRLETMEAAVAAAAGPDKPKAVTIRKVASRSTYGSLSPDGRYFSDVNWTLGNMAVYDTKTGEYRDITDEGTWEKPGQFGDHSVWSPDSKQLAYPWYKGGNYNLRILNVDGGEPRTLVPHSEAGAAWPRAWTPDGKYILAIQEESQLALVDIETGSIRIIKRFPDGCHTWNMSISPDGRYIVYEWFSGQEQSGDIRILSIDGKVDQPLVEHPANDLHPYWTPDGRGMVFSSDRSGNPGLWYIPVTAGKAASEPRLIHNLPSGGYGFSEDGTYYYEDGHSTENVFVAEVDFDLGTLKTGPEVVSQRFEGTNVNPLWSPDGAKLAYVSERENKEGEGNFVLVIRDMQSGEEQDLSPKLVFRGVGSRWWKWSPDGKAIFLTARRQVGGEISLYRFDIETESATHLSEGWLLCFVVTPEGDEIIFIRRGYRREIVQLNLASGTERVLANSEETLTLLAISPDGSQLAYYACESGGCTPFELFVMSREDGSTRKLWSAPDEWRFSEKAGIEWMPDGAHLLLATYHPGEDQQQFYLVDARTGERKPIGDPMKGNQVGRVDMHPNSTTIAFGAGEVHGEIWAIENLVLDQ